MGAEVLHAGGRTDGQTYVKKLRVAFRDSAKSDWKEVLKALQILTPTWARQWYNQFILFFSVEYLPEDGIKGPKHVEGLACAYKPLYLIIVPLLE